jgi:hypothetical protein
MQADTDTEIAKREVRANEEFEGSRPGKGTALLVAGAVLAVALYNLWPQIASALDVG